MFDELKYSAEELGLEDPVIFQHKRMMDENLPIGLRCAIACNIAPFYHPKVGILPPPRFIETLVEVPQFTSVEDAEAFLAKLPVLVGSGDITPQSALELSTLIRNWIISKHAAAELELKRLDADVSSGEQRLIIVGGLPNLPGASVIMPGRDSLLLNGQSNQTLLPIDSAPDENKT
jgi:hypothetical protein